MRDAWDGANAEPAKKQLQRLAASLQAKHPGAAASLREGLEETLTVQALGITGALYRTLRTTNPIKNLNGLIVHCAPVDPMVTTVGGQITQFASLTLSGRSQMTCS